MPKIDAAIRKAWEKNPGELYRRMREIAEEYASRMDWGWEDKE